MSLLRLVLGVVIAKDLDVELVATQSGRDTLKSGEKITCCSEWLRRSRVICAVGLPVGRWNQVNQVYHSTNIQPFNV